MFIRAILLGLLSITSTALVACDEVWWGSPENDEVRINDRGVFTVVKGSFHSRNHARVFDFNKRNCIYLGAGDDQFYLYSPRYLPLTIYGGAGNDLIITGAGADLIYGGMGHDSIYSGRGNDRIFGGPGRDDLNGEEGDDYIDGGDGRDVLRGSVGNDTLVGGRGSDDLQGNSGEDNFVQGPGCDTSDLEHAEDDFGGDGTFFAELFASCV